MTFETANRNTVITLPTAKIVLALAAGPLAIRWGGSGVVAQPATGGFVLAVLVFAVAWTMNAKRIYLSGPLLMVLALVGVLTLAFVIHGTPAGFTLLPRIVLYAVAGLSVGAVVVTPERFFVVSKWGIYLTALALFASSLFANVNLIGGLLEYFATLNHDAVVYKTYRPIYNAFAAGANIEYTASVGNSVSAGLTIFFIGLISHRIGGGRLGLSGWAALSIVGIFLITLFSSTAILVIALWIAIIGAARLSRRPALFIGLAYLVITLLVIASLAGVDPFALITAPLEADEKSRGFRLDQYSFALDLLGSNPIFGVGFVESGGFNIHNLPLFSWVSGGIIPLLMVLAIYFGLAKNAVSGIIGAMSSKMTAQSAIMIGLPIMFAARTLFGGGGGLPDMASCLAAGICFSVARYSTADQIRHT